MVLKKKNRANTKKQTRKPKFKEKKLGKIQVLIVFSLFLVLVRFF